MNWGESHLPPRAGSDRWCIAVTFFRADLSAVHFSVPFRAQGARLVFRLPEAPTYGLQRGKRAITHIFPTK